MPQGVLAIQDGDRDEQGHDMHDIACRELILSPLLLCLAWRNFVSRGNDRLRDDESRRAADVPRSEAKASGHFKGEGFKNRRILLGGSVRGNMRRW